VWEPAKQLCSAEFSKNEGRAVQAGRQPTLAGYIQHDSVLYNKHQVKEKALKDVEERSVSQACE
jgi:hypothetical protein